MTTLIYLGIVALLFLGITEKIYRKYWDQGLDADVRFSEKEVEEGQQLAVKVVVENRKMLPLPTLMVKFEMDRNLLCVDGSKTSVTDKQYRNEFITIMPNERVTRKIDITATKRGFYSIDEWSFVTTDILFKALFTKNEKNYTWLYVYPSRSKYVADSEIFCQMNGECLANRMLWEDSMEFKGIRDYTQTDPMHKVNWKATARTGELKVNQYYDSTSQRFTIFLNVDQSEILKYYDLIEESIRITRNFIESFVIKGIPVRVISNGVDKLTKKEIYIREGAGLSHIDECLKQLAKMDIHSPKRNMTELIREEISKGESAAQYSEISLLISAEQTMELAEAYQEYAGQLSNANWLVPIHASTKRYYDENVEEARKRGVGEHSIRTEFLVIEELEG